ncbi:MAG: response regulator [Myxococcales bacterium]|nr:response regulator [Myxococcales bacterium]
MRVLIVDDEVNVRFAIERRLRKGGMETDSASTVRHAIDRLRAEPYDVVLCDLRMPGGNGTQLLQWLGSYSPSTMIIVVSAFITPEFRKTYKPTGRLRILEKPVDLDVLMGTLEEIGPRKGFYGNSIEVELFDYVQMIALSGRDKLVEVTTPAGKGLIWFEHGDIVHVEYDQYRGEMAFYRLLGVNRGTFKEIFNREPSMRTVVRSSTHLLMEAARRADEGILEDAPHEDGDDETSFGSVAQELAAEEDQAQPLEGEDPFAEPEPEAFPEPEAIPEPVAADVSEGFDLALGFEETEEVEEEVAGATELDLEPPPSRELTFHSSSPAGLPVVDDDDLVDPFEEPDEEEMEAVTGRHSTLPQPPPLPQSRLPKPKPKAPAPGVPEVVPRQGSFTEEEKAVLAGLSEEPPPSPGGAGLMGHAAMFEDPDMRQVMLEQFWQFDGINGVAIISSTGKVLAEDMRNNSALVTLAGFYMRGAARIARTLGYNVFDGVVARSVAGSQLVMVSMGAASAVLSVDAGTDPEAVRDAVMGVE